VTKDEEIEQLRKQNGVLLVELNRVSEALRDLRPRYERDLADLQAQSTRQKIEIEALQAEIAELRSEKLKT
jgi:hypothetical protein